jgi:hypothetical protein
MGGKSVTKAAIATLFGLLALAPAAGAAGWTTLAGVPSSATGLGGVAPSIAVDPQGDQYLAFADVSAGVGTRVHLYERAPGGAFVSVLDLPEPGASAPRVAAGKDGTVALAWENKVASTIQAIPHLIIRRPGGSFGPEIQEPQSAESILIGVAALPDGTVLLAWQDDTAPDLHAESFPPTAPPKDESPTGIVSITGTATLTTSGAGEAVLAWEDSPSANVAEIAFSDRPVGGSFAPASALAMRTLGAGESSQGEFLGPVSLDDAGDLLGVTVRAVTSSGTTTDTLRANTRLAGQATIQHATLDSKSGSPASLVPYFPTALLDPARNAIVEWTDASNQLLDATATAAGGFTFGSPSPFAAITPGPCTTFAPHDAVRLAALSSGGLAGVYSDPPSLGFCAGNPLIPLSPAPGGGVLAGPPIEPLGDTSPVIVADSSGDAFAPVADPNIAAGKAASLSVPASDSISGVSVAWDFGDGASGSGLSVTHTWAKPGTYTVAVRATDGASNVASVTAQVVVKDKTPPVISHASLSHKSFKARHGTKVRFKLSELATVKFTVTHKVAGRRSGKHCISTHSHRIPKRLRCKLTKTVTTSTHRSLGAGAHTLSFKHKLAPGSYQLVITATDPAGNKGAPRRLKFKIIR